MRLTKQQKCEMGRYIVDQVNAGGTVREAYREHVITLATREGAKSGMDSGDVIGRIRMVASSMGVDMTNDEVSNASYQAVIGHFFGGRQ